jgi:hypothetical protein
MKLIATVQGTVGLFASHDDVVPPNGVAVSDLIRVIGDTYKFSVRPPVEHLQTPLMSQLVFQSGVLEIGNEKLPITQLVTFPTGEMVSAINTDLAERVMDHYTALLDRELGYRFASAPTRKIYQSNIVVEFDKGLEEKITALKKIEELVSGDIKRSEPFKIKRLAFGSGRVGLPFIQLSLSGLEKTDFVIERRDPEPYDKNRYFCGAPTKTQDLIRLVEKIEQEISTV